MRLIVVDDDTTVLLVLQNFLESLGHSVATADNGQDAFDMIQRGNYRVVISDWEMPGIDGIELCRKIRERSGEYVYFMLLTSREDKASLIDGLDSGADDFLTKPFEPEELRVRLRTAERIIGLESRDLVIFSLARLAESRDCETGEHLERIREYSQALAQQLSVDSVYSNVIDADFVRSIYTTSPLHDIGKVGIPDSVLLKPGKLTPQEFEIMKEHTEIGRITLEDALQAHPNAHFLREARDIAWCHHEKFDGTGYPRQLKGEEIPLSARIVSVCDVYDALTSKRHYKAAFSHEESRNKIIDGRGAHFDPVIVDAFLAVEHIFQGIRQQYSNDEADNTNSWLVGETEAYKEASFLVG